MDQSLPRRTQLKAVFIVMSLLAFMLLALPSWADHQRLELVAGGLPVGRDAGVDGSPPRM